MTRHVPVMTREAVQHLGVRSGDCVFDGTVGSGGHARAICTRLGADGTLIGADRDREAIKQTRKTLTKADCSAETCLQTADFRTVKSVISDCGESEIDSALLDLGFRSEQLESGRGFSFQEEAPLLMTYKHPDDVTDDDTTARDILNDWDQESITQILSGYANEVYSEQIASAIVNHRQNNTFTTTTDLNHVIKQTVPEGYRKGRRNPATKTYQALRMAVNDEVRALEEGLRNIFELLAGGGRLVVISFHSVEDRIVKQFFAEMAAVGRAVNRTESPITPDSSETDFNARAHSGKLRSLHKQ